MKVRHLLTAFVGALLLSSAVHAQLIVWYDSGGFERPTFQRGVLDGQDG